MPTDSDFRKLPTASSCPDVDWFKDLPLPKGRTFVCTGREKIKLDQIERTNEEGQVVNIARELGTNKENVQDLANNIKINGVLLVAQPPFVGTNKRLFDGFTRTEAIVGMGLEYWVFNVVEPMEGFTWSDVWDEIGLGANNHPPSKSATRGDFTKALARWVATQKQEPTQGQCVDWINHIPHSFSQEIVSNIAQTVLKTERARKSMESVEPKDVIARVSKDENFTSRVEVIPINISGSNTYVMRAFFQALKAVSNPKKDMIRGVGFLKGVPAEKAEETRKAGMKLLDEYNDMFEEAFQQRLKVGAKYRLIDVDYIYPQILEVETSLIPVEKTE
tara:strand:- start:88 stop:1086 length:999 start_codon:yes stop_codon:yes gene_type:complete